MTPGSATEFSLFNDKTNEEMKPMILEYVVGVTLLFFSEKSRDYIKLRSFSTQ